MNDLAKTKLLIYDVSGTSYTDRTEEVFDVTQDSVAFAWDSGDKIYIGREKPFSAIFFHPDPDHLNAVTSTLLTAEYYDGTTWQTLTLLTENTKVFSRSGFIKWATPYADTTESDLDWETSEVNSIDRFWIRLNIGASFTAGTKLLGMTLVYSDDAGLKEKDYGILNLLPKDEDGVRAASHLLSHLAARDEIIQRLRNDGKIKISSETSKAEDIDEWDLLDIGQIREAATQKALSLIYLTASDNPDDIYWAKHQLAEGKYQSALKLALLAIDLDDDGENDQNENTQGFGSGTYMRG